MEKSRLLALGGIIVIIAVVALGWLLGVSPQLGEARLAATALVDVEAQNLAHEQELVELEARFDDIDSYREEAEDLREQIPAGVDAPVLIGQLDKLAAGSQVTLTAISIIDALPYLPAVPVAPAVIPTTGEATAEADAAAAEAAAAAAEATAAAVPAANGLTPENFATVPMSVTVEGDYNAVLDFIGGLQSGSRLMLVTGFSVTSAESADPAAPTSGVVTAVITAFVYALQDGSAAAAGTTVP